MRVEYGFWLCKEPDCDTAPTVVGSHMSLLRPATPRLAGDRRIGKPGEVSQPCHEI